MEYNFESFLPANVNTMNTQQYNWYNKIKIVKQIDSKGCGGAQCFRQCNMHEWLYNGELSLLACFFFLCVFVWCVTHVSCVCVVSFLEG